jgi:hypothetical protein
MRTQALLAALLSSQRRQRGKACMALRHQSRMAAARWLWVRCMRRPLGCRKARSVVQRRVPQSSARTPAAAQAACACMRERRRHQQGLLRLVRQKLQQPLQKLRPQLQMQPLQKPLQKLLQT